MATMVFVTEVPILDPMMIGTADLTSSTVKSDRGKTSYGKVVFLETMCLRNKTMSMDKCPPTEIHKTRPAAFHNAASVLIGSKGDCNLQLSGSILTRREPLSLTYGKESCDH